MVDPGTAPRTPVLRQKVVFGTAIYIYILILYYWIRCHSEQMSCDIIVGLSSGDLRLIGGTSRGRLEIFYNGVWGTVCDDLFGANEAESACRQLGFFGYSRYDDVDDLG